MKKLISILLISIIAIVSLITFRATAEEYIHQIWNQLIPDPMSRNTYSEGQCTAYVFDKVKKEGMMIGRDWHDAKHWATRAEADGYIVNDKPKTGAILQSPRGKMGHVAFVEHVYKNGNIAVSEMNYYKPYEITKRIVTIPNQQRYSYIHPKENPKNKG